MKAWKSRSLPGLPRTEKHNLLDTMIDTKAAAGNRGGFLRLCRLCDRCRRFYHVGMALLPNSDRAILDIRKIEDYCLNPAHPRGRHKARSFRESLGITRTDARWLRDALLDAVRSSDAIELATDAYGSRWRADVSVSRHGTTVVVRTAWIVRTGEQAPRFPTCWVLQ